VVVAEEEEVEVEVEAEEEVQEVQTLVEAVVVHHLVAAEEAVQVLQIAFHQKAVVAHSVVQFQAIIVHRELLIPVMPLLILEAILLQIDMDTTVFIILHFFTLQFFHRFYSTATTHYITDTIKIQDIIMHLN
jgi:hypothetical protein